MCASPAAGSTSDAPAVAAYVARDGFVAPPADRRRDQRGRRHGVNRTPRSPTSPVDGYLLIEALAALLLAASLIGSLHALHLGLARDSRLAAERTFAGVWAEAGLEAALGAIRAGDLPASTLEAWPATAVTDPAASPPPFWRRTDILPMTEGMSVEITVAWPHPDAGPPRRIVLSALARPGAAADSGQADDKRPPVISP